MGLGATRKHVRARQTTRTSPRTPRQLLPKNAPGQLARAAQNLLPPWQGKWKWKWTPRTRPRSSLLATAAHGSLEKASLPLLLLASAGGLLALRTSQLGDATRLLLLGYALEAAAFLLYPVALRVYSPRVAVTAWSASSTLTALLADLALGQVRLRLEHPAGVLCLTAGVYLVAS